MTSTPVLRPVQVAPSALLALHAANPSRYPALFERQGLRYANTGDWIENCTALVEDYQGKMRLLHYSDQMQWQEDLSCELVTSKVA